MGAIVGTYIPTTHLYFHKLYSKCNHLHHDLNQLEDFPSFRGGEGVDNKLKKYREAVADERILSIVQNKGDRTPLEYLRAIALNYQIIH